MLTVSQNRQKSLLINCPNLAETVQADQQGEGEFRCEAYEPKG